jgi:hypothetical protein
MLLCSSDGGSTSHSRGDSIRHDVRVGFHAIVQCISLTFLVGASGDVSLVFLKIKKPPIRSVHYASLMVLPMP